MAKTANHDPFVFPPSEVIHDTWFAMGTDVEPRFLSAARTGRSAGDHSHYYATGVFDGVGADRGVDGKYRIWAPHLHSARLVAHAEAMGIIRPGELNPAVVLQWMIEMASCNLMELPSGVRLYIRPDVFPASTALGVGFERRYGFSIITRERSTYLKSDKPGVRVWYPTRVCRANELCGAPSVKSATNYGNVARFKNEGVELCGAPETLLESLEGWLAETTGSNIFLRIGDELWTPGVNSSILPGITRSYVILIARALGVEFRTGYIQPQRLKEAQEVFLTGTWAGITFVEDILKGREKPEPITAPFQKHVPGELSAKIAAIYNALLVYDLDTVARLAPKLDISESWWAEVPA